MNGYSNRETWATVLVLMNTEVLYNQLQAGGNPIRVLAWGLNRVDINTGEPWVDRESLGDMSQVNWNEVSEALNNV